MPIKFRSMPSLVLAACLPVFPALADDVRGAERILCSTMDAHVCFPGAECTRMSPEELNIPHFIEIDVDSGRMSTTEASGLNRSTDAQVAERHDGHLLIQGHEQQRAFSLMIDAATGHASLASAGMDRGVVAFAACTPID
ncbi:MAG: hypothetical protein R3233_02375 [Xanthomonadales bacterium]|nr:hypothetical protein [Xanthomonadales bacterium]